MIAAAKRQVAPGCSRSGGGRLEAAVAACRPQVPKQPAMGLVARGRLGGGGVLDRPTTDYDVSKRSGWDSDRDSNIAVMPPPTETGRDGGSTDRQSNSPPGGGNHRLLLLDSPKHKEQLVVKGLVQTVPNCDETYARNCFATSKELGMAIITSCLKEHAEFYMQQLYRYGVRTAIEPDSTTA